MAVGGFNCEGLKVTSFDPNQARIQGGAMGAITHINSESCTKKLQDNQAFDV